MLVALVRVDSGRVSGSKWRRMATSSSSKSCATTFTANVDREALSRAIRNLLDNAVKYSPDARNIEVTLTHEADSVAIGVRDKGIGIPD